MIDAGTTWPLVTHAFASVAYGRCTSGSASGSICRRGRDGLHAFFRQSPALSGGALETRSLSSAFARDGFGIAAHDVGTGVVSPRIVERVGVDSTRVVPDHRPSLEQLEPCWPRGGSACSRLTFDGGRRRPLSLSQFLGDPLGLQTRLPPARLRRLPPLAQLLLATFTGAIRKRLLRRRWLAECPSSGITCFGGYYAVGGSEKKMARQSCPWIHRNKGGTSLRNALSASGVGAQDGSR